MFDDVRQHLLEFSVSNFRHLSHSHNLFGTTIFIIYFIPIAMYFSTQITKPFFPFLFVHCWRLTFVLIFITLLALNIFANSTKKKYIYKSIRIQYESIIMRSGFLAWQRNINRINLIVKVTGV